MTPRSVGPRWSVAPLVAAVSLNGARASAAAVHAPSSAALPSWNEAPSRTAIVDFVERVTTQGSLSFIAPAKRIAVFDNDGTLWCEQPMYAQLAFALDRIKAMAPQHPEWPTEQPFKAVLDGDSKSLAAQGEHALLEVMAATHAGMTPEAFDRKVRAWLRLAQNPRFHRRHVELAYPPMIEVLAYLRAHGFKTFIVSGGGQAFMRAFASETYGVPPEQVIGSSGGLNYELRAGRPELIKLPTVAFVDDGPGKPVAIERSIGARPVIAFGNSDGDLQMLEWTTAGAGPRLGVLVHHTDAAREVAYDRDSAIGALDRALDAAPKHGWVVVDMKRDWKVVFSSARTPAAPRR